MKVAGRRVLVTGASRGIGRALAEAFAAAGGRVVVLARNKAALDEVAAATDGVAVAADLSDPSGVEGLIDRVEREAGGPIDILVNNAGLDLAGAFVGNESADVEQLMRVNLLTPMELCRQAIPGMLERGGGHIVNVSSLAGVGVFPGLAPYAASKAGLSQFTAGLRADHRGQPLGTTLVELGPVPTDMLGHVDDYKPTGDSFRRFYRTGLLADVPKERVATDVVAAVEHNRRHVRHPKRAVLFPLLTEAPRRLTEVLLSGVRHQPH